MTSQERIIIFASSLTSALNIKNAMGDNIILM